MNMDWVQDCPWRDKETGEVSCNINAILDRVFIWPQEAPDNIGSIVLPDQVKETFRYAWGVVLSVGPGFTSPVTGVFTATELRVGDIVLYDSSIPWETDWKKPASDEVGIIKFMGEKDVKGLVRDGEMFPCPDFVFLELVPEKKTSGGVFYPGASTHVRFAEITGVGDKVDEVEVGDKVMFESKFLTPLKAGKEDKWFSLNRRYLTAKVEEDDNE